MAHLRNLERNFSYQPIPLHCDVKKTACTLKLDLNTHCIRHPTKTFFIHVENRNLIAWGIEYDDLLIVEKSDILQINDLLVVEKNGQYKFYQFFSEINGEKILFSLDAQEQNLRLQQWEEICVAGVITNVVHKMRHRTPVARYAA